MDQADIISSKIISSCHDIHTYVAKKIAHLALKKQESLTHLPINMLDFKNSI